MAINDMALSLEYNDEANYVNRENNIEANCLGITLETIETASLRNIGNRKFNIKGNAEDSKTNINANNVFKPNNNFYFNKVVIVIAIIATIIVIKKL